MCAVDCLWWSDWQVAEERLANMRTVRAFVQEHNESLVYNTRIDNVLQLSYKEALARGCFWAMVACFSVFLLCTFCEMIKWYYLPHVKSLSISQSFTCLGSTSNWPTPCPKIATPLEIGWCKIVNTWQIFFTKYETFMETIILNWSLKFVLKVATIGLDASS